MSRADRLAAIARYERAEAERDALAARHARCVAALRRLIETTPRYYALESAWAAAEAALAEENAPAEERGEPEDWEAQGGKFGRRA